MALHPGDPPVRQPVHVVYGGGHLFRAETAAKLGEVARRALAEYAPDPAALDEALGLGSLAGPVHERVVAKLEREPVEDFRIDFEDGYGTRPDADEDRDVAAAAREVAKGHRGGTLPGAISLRVKPLTEELRTRSARTLRLFLATLLEQAGTLPAGFVVTLPKITSLEQVKVFAALLAALERELGLDDLAAQGPVAGTRGIEFRPFAPPSPSRMVGAAWRKSSTREAAIGAVCDTLASAMS